MKFKSIGIEHIYSNIYMITQELNTRNKLYCSNPYVPGKVNLFYVKLRQFE